MRAISIAMLVLLLVGCGAVKRRTRIEEPSGQAALLTASLDELLQLVNERYAAIENLSVANLEVRFVGVQKGYLEEYRSAKGYWVAKWPDSIFVNILNPLTSSTVVTMASEGDVFQIWVPRENKFLTGKTGVKIDEENPLYNVRPHHLLPGVMVEKIPVDDARYRYFMEQREDPGGSYYVVSVIELQEYGNAVQLARRLWIERSSLRLVRQQYYEVGEVISEIRYNKVVEIDGKLVNSGIEIERKRDNYRMRFEFPDTAVRIDRPLREGIFKIRRPPGAELVVVTDTETGS